MAGAITGVRCWRCGSAVLGAARWTCPTCGAKVAIGHEVCRLRYLLQNREPVRRCRVCGRVIMAGAHERRPECSSSYAAPIRPV